MERIPKRLLARWFIEKANIAPKSLWRWNIVLSILFAVQGAAILLFSTPYHVAITMMFQTRDSLQSQLSGHFVAALASQPVIVLNLSYLVAGYLFVAALAHLVAVAVWRPGYDAALRKGVNPIRWIEYAATAALILMILTMLIGLHDLVILLLIGTLAAVTPLCAWTIEARNPVSRRQARPQWLNAVAGCITGLVPWVTIALSLAVTNIYGSGAAVPRFLYWTCLVVLGLFVAFGVNLYLLYTKRARWAVYAYGERWYMILGVVLKTYLAWQIFVGVLRP